MAFTTWCDVLTTMNDLIASGDIMSVNEVVKGDKRISYRSADEFWNMYSWVESRCNNEQGINTRRTYAANGGRGRVA